MGNVNMEASQINYRNNSKKSVRTVETALDNLFTKSDGNAQDIIDLTAAMTAKADKIDIAPTFSAENTYFDGDLVFQSGRLWKFTTDHTPGEWNQEEVTATNIDLAIKSSGATLPDYSTTETATGQKWTDGNDIYCKVYHVAAMPNNTTLTLEEDFSLTKNVIDIKGICKAVVTNKTYQYPMAYYGAALTDACFACVIENDLVVVSKGDWTTYSGDVIVYYTKTA